MSNQNKAHAVNVGSAYKPMGKSGLINVASDGSIINQLARMQQGDLNHAVGVARIGYNGGSKKPKQYPRTETRVFLYPHKFNHYALNARGGSQSLGVWARSNPPDCLRQFRAPPPLHGGNQSKKPKEGIMPKNSTVAIATSQTQSQTFTAGQAIQRHTDTTPITDYFCGVVQPSKWYRRDLEPSPVFTMGKAVAL